MKVRIVGLLILFVLPVLAYSQKGPQVDEGAKYINYKYEGVTPSTVLPNGVKHFGGGLIGDINADPVYGVAQTEKGTLKMMWLEVSTGQDATGVTGWQVLDVLSFRNLLKNEQLFFAGDPSINCRQNGNEIPNLVGRGQVVRNKGVFVPAKLWLADIAKRKFEPVALSGFKCEYAEP